MTPHLWVFVLALQLPIYGKRRIDRVPIDVTVQAVTLLVE
jgi:hypothetical protein